jgi:glycosyltransferase involved in cell wall biosynthesis
MPGYNWFPSGGYRVVYEYANRLTSRGHSVSVVHPRRLRFQPPERLSIRQRARRTKYNLIELLSTPVIDWQVIDHRVKLLFVPTSGERDLPDADVLFATGWQTVSSVLQSPQSKGEKFYLIQGHETWLGPKDLVNQTWLAPINKVVVSRWLLELGDTIGASNLTYIPIAVDHRLYRVLRPIPTRPRQVVMALSWVGIKGSKDGVTALQIAKQKFPDLRVVLFGNSRRPSWVPGWMRYFRNPDQTRIVNDFYNGSSIVLSPSLSEGFGLPPAEGAACGCAIVATDIQGHREYVQDHLTGLLSPPQDPKALARNLCLLLGNDDLRVRLAHSANEVIKQFDWDRSADLMEDFITRGASRPPLGHEFSSAVQVSPT